MQHDVYARLNKTKTKILEYPVYPIHIKKRAHPIQWYSKCVFEAKPDIPVFHYAREALKIVDGTVYIEYVIEPYTLDHVLSDIAVSDSNNPHLPNIAPAIGDLDQATIDRILFLATEHIQTLLDDFAKTKGYTNLVYAISYKDSSVPQYASEAQRALDLRDQTWSSLYDYFQEVINGIQPVPINVSEIESKIPELTW